MHMKIFKEGMLGLVQLEDIAQAIFRQEHFLQTLRALSDCEVIKTSKVYSGIWEMSFCISVEIHQDVE